LSKPGPGIGRIHVPFKLGGGSLSLNLDNLWGARSLDVVDFAELTAEMSAVDGTRREVMGRVNKPAGRRQSARNVEFNVVLNYSKRKVRQ
jgi:hypothetical protein